MAKKSDGSIKFNGLRRQAEKLLQTTRDDVAAMPVKEVQQLVHELQVHQIELDIQNEELRRAHIELEAARDRYADLYDFSPAGHLTLDVSGKIVEANLRAGTMLGVNRKELIGQSFGRFVVLDDRAIFYGHCRESVKSGTRQICEVRLLNRSGASSYVHLESLAVYEEPGHIIHWRTAILDITDRKVVERELKAQQAQLQGIIGSAMDAIITVDEGQRVVLFNRAAESMFLCRATDVIDQMLDQFIPERLRQVHHDQIGAFTLLRTTSRSIEPPGMLFGRRANGEEFPIEASISHIRVDDKNLLTIIIRDVTKRKQAEQEQARLIEELTRSQQHFQSLFNWTPSAVGISTLAEGRFSDVNDGFTRLTGYTREEVIGRTSLELGMWADPWERAVVLREMREQGHLRNREGVLRTKSGEFRSIMISVDPIQVGTTPCLIYLAHDITDRKRAEETLRLAKFSMERAADAVYWIDSQAKILDVNEAASLMLGYSKDELCAMTVHDLNPDFPRDMWPGFWADTQRRGTMVFETAHRAKNGRLIPVEVSVNYLFYEGKEYHCAFVRDITGRKQGAEEIAQLAERLELATSAAPIGVWDWNILKNELVWDDRMFALYHLKNEEFGGAYDAWLARVHPDDRARCDETIRQALCKERAYDIEFRICCPNGAVRVIKADGQVKWNADGTPLRMTGVNYDITERKQAEEALEASERLLNNILENIPSYVFATDRQHHYILLSDDLARFYGKPKDEILGKTHHHVFPKNVADVIQATNEQIMTSGIPQQLEEVVESPVDGVPRILFITKSPLRDEKGQIYGISGIATDITEHKRLEAQLRQAQKMDAVGRLAGGVAHDFNNLLTIINGYSALLIDRLSGEDPRREMVVETLKAGERASELTKQLLAFSRKQVLMPQPLNFNDSLRLISSMLSRLLGEEVTLTMDLAPDLWSINGDKGQLNQVTMNLAINARDAMPDGGTLMIATRNVSVTTERPGHHRMMPPGDYVHVSVHDTGHGMSPETLSHLFEPFFTTKEVGQGTGLGLATVYGIVKQSQGYIFADSTLDQGSTFHLYYPRVIAAPAMAEIPPVRHRKGSERLLVIEDQDSVRALIVQALKQDGYHVVEAANGEEALQAAASLLEPIQALVTDVIMPQMSGLVVAERLRVIWPGIRVLFMSGYVDLTKPAFLDKPGTAFIQKPFLPDELARHLRDLLDRSI
jgi:two-component system, cell cycle sensor histidine kinase and response regulator CckA